MHRIMRKLNILISLILILFTFACADKTTSTQASEQDQGQIPIAISLVPLEEIDITVTQAIATLTKDNDEISQALTINQNTAFATINNLSPGIWHLEVELFSNEYAVAFGETDVEVFPGQTSEVNLTLRLNDITGSIEILVDWEINQTQPERFLFIGNSYTYYNDGLEYMFRNIAQSSSEELTIEVQSITGGGLTLQNHFQNHATHSMILNGNWDMVILQEQSQMPILDTQSFLTYASKLDSLIDISGAQTCFFMTWAREYDQSQINGLASAYLQAGQELDAIVVPVGQIFNYVYEDDNQINLYMGDGSHPSLHGSYLAGLTFYKEFFNYDLSDVLYIPTGISINEANYLKESVENWYSF